jgi:hypothetical protein
MTNIANLDESNNVNGLRDNFEQFKITANQETETNEEEKEDEISIAQQISELPNRKWIKELILEDELVFEDFPDTECFIKVANIILDTEHHSTILENLTKAQLYELYSKTNLKIPKFNIKLKKSILIKLLKDNIPNIESIAKKKHPKKTTKKRATSICFVPIISKNAWKCKNEWIYIFIYNNKIIKIGGTRDGLYGRCGSYNTGHHTKERGKSGDCSKTNAKVYNTFEFYLKNIENTQLEMYGYKLPKSTKTEKVWGYDTTFEVQTYHKYESLLLQKYKAQNGQYPILSDNADPNV